MTRAQEVLLDEAKDLWERGYPVPYDVAVHMLAEGLDVQRLEAKYLDN